MPDQEKVALDSRAILDAVFKAVTGLIVLAVGWTANELSDLRSRSNVVESRLSIIEANRYTPRDALDFERQVNSRLSSLSASAESLTGELKVVREILERLEKK